MVKTKLLVFATLLIIITIYNPGKVYADMGPKPSSEIKIYYNNKKIPDDIFYAQMLWCPAKDLVDEGWLNIQPNKSIVTQLHFKQYDESKNCYWVNSVLSWGGDCTKSTCNFNYSIPDQFKLAIYIPSLNKAFVTNEVTNTSFDSYYKVNLFSNGNAVLSKSLFAHISDFLFAYVVTNIVELFIASLYITVTKLPKRLYFFIIVGNSITLPIVWFIMPGRLVLAEIIAGIIEAVIIYRYNRKYIKAADAVSLSLACNIISMFVGVLITL